MPNDFISGLIQQYGFPVAFAVWVLWSMWTSKSREDPTRELMATLTELRVRMARVETILEERKK